MVGISLAVKPLTQHVTLGTALEKSQKTRHDSTVADACLVSYKCYCPQHWYVCLCVSAPEAINNQWHNMDPYDWLIKFNSV